MVNDDFGFDSADMALFELDMITGLVMLDDAKRGAEPDYNSTQRRVAQSIRKFNEEDRAFESSPADI